MYFHVGLSEGCLVKDDSKAQTDMRWKWPKMLLGIGWRCPIVADRLFLRRAKIAVSISQNRHDYEGLRVGLVM